MPKIWAHAFALFLVLHGYLTLATYAMPSPDAVFDATRSWLFEAADWPKDAQVIASVILAGIQITAFALAALGLIGVPGLARPWRGSTSRVRWCRVP